MYIYIYTILYISTIVYTHMQIFYLGIKFISHVIKILYRYNLMTPWQYVKIIYLTILLLLDI